MQGYDLAIVGAGAVGASLAIALQQSGLRIALIDAKLPHAEDNRLFALNQNSCQFLSHIGLWPSLIPHATPIHEVKVSCQGQFGGVSLSHEALRSNALGYVIPARLIEASLHDALALSPNCILYRPYALTGMTINADGALLTIKDKQTEKTIAAPLVIAADGVHSTVRKQLNIATSKFDYQQSALVTVTTLKHSHHHIAHERFIKDGGAIAMLPLAGKSCATIWTAENAKISDLMNQSDDAFLQTLQQTFGYRLGRLEKIEKRHVYPLALVKAKAIVQEGVYLLGNAAHTLHPIAALGLNLSLYEVAILAAGIKEKVASGLFPLTLKDLTEMHEKMRDQQAFSITFSHRLAQVFSGQSRIKQMALTFLLTGFDLVPPIKKSFIKQMMGKQVFWNYFKAYPGMF